MSTCSLTRTIATCVWGAACTTRAKNCARILTCAASSSSAGFPVSRARKTGRFLRADQDLFEIEPADIRTLGCSEKPWAATWFSALPTDSRSGSVALATAVAAAHFACPGRPMWRIGILIAKAEHELRLRYPSPGLAPAPGKI